VVGVSCMLVSMAAEALRLVLMQRLMSDTQLHPIEVGEAGPGEGGGGGAFHVRHGCALLMQRRGCVCLWASSWGAAAHHRLLVRGTGKRQRAAHDVVAQCGRVSSLLLGHGRIAHPTAVRGHMPAGADLPRSRLLGLAAAANRVVGRWGAPPGPAYSLALAPACPALSFWCCASAMWGTKPMPCCCHAPWPSCAARLPQVPCGYPSRTQGAPSSLLPLPMQAAA